MLLIGKIKCIIVKIIFEVKSISCYNIFIGTGELGILAEKKRGKKDYFVLPEGE